jgi:general transcriptional corepressor TUP1
LPPSGPGLPPPTPGAAERERERDIREREREQRERERDRDRDYPMADAPPPSAGGNSSSQNNSSVAPYVRVGPPSAFSEAEFLEGIDPNNVPPELKKEGGDWFAVWNPKAKRVLDVNLVHTLSHDSVVCCVRFSADGKFLATGCNRVAQIFDVKTGANIW